MSLLIGTKSERVDLSVTALLLCGICLHYWGIVANMIVIAANNNAMPVIVEPGEMIVPDQGVFMDTTRSGNLLLLSDWVRIDFPHIEDTIPEGKIGEAFTWWAIHLRYPLAGGVYMVSIGDMMRWLGSLILICITPVVVLLIARRTYLILSAAVRHK